MMIGHLKPDAQRILAYLIEHGSATPDEISDNLHTSEGRKRLSEIRQAGVPLRWEWEKGFRADGTPCRYKRHYLIREEFIDGTHT